MFEPIILPKAKCDEPKPTEKRELSSSGKAVTKATNTVPTNTLLMLNQDDSQKHL